MENGLGVDVDVQGGRQQEGRGGGGVALFTSEKLDTAMKIPQQDMGRRMDRRSSMARRRMRSEGLQMAAFSDGKTAL